MNNRREHCPEVREREIVRPMLERAAKAHPLPCRVVSVDCSDPRKDKAVVSFAPIRPKDQIKLKFVFS